MKRPNPKISMIAAMARNRVIGGKDGGIPWSLPRDSAHFRNYTAGKFMLLGRTTFEEMDGWFTTQTPVVLTRDFNFDVKEGFVADSVERAVSIAREQSASELVVSGGASIYQAALSFADELILTFVEAEVEGEHHFPGYEAVAKWEIVDEERFEADAENEFAMTFATLKRVIG
ncbi:dihydrofolate reductase [Verrucomicrobiales bacterium]|jgi:dihydrofolate reductase|nr:dihydrofolate reductase [Verrucomicrobiales bacterium]MDC0275674.1 dihydrofolate reductase [Verrucomicrobiales bacterium]